MDTYLNNSKNEQSSYWPCPAKLNLFLHFTGQRSDGYHELQSVFQLLDFGDQLKVNPRTDGKITFDCNIEELKGDDNLVVQAAKKLQSIISQNYSKGKMTLPGADLYLEKRLPAGGGIGGGSSDCATALVALNHIWQLELNLDTLAEIGLSLGADVPIFVRGRTAFVEGIGEKITPFEMPEIWYLVVYPGCHVTTSKIFSNPLLTRNSKAITIRDLNALELPFKGKNSMQTLVCSDYPAVKSALDWLNQFSNHARMTGSGSCLFLAFDKEQEMRKIASRCEWSHFVAKGVNISPLHKRLLELIGNG
ncbi:4-(cytidine 5'-diphospho)-2-C-methyl-D-erythritol kinase [Aliikangiella sp. G2MR2-5]|uniref:4-(cytidine 5'-diphospho)-2-C-methyl-D-erythritol kinase n=1 Tax=Aliikangiella sp. G2MR2-5 TaxID=2788943 RepID=UPI0018A888E4